MKPGQLLQSLRRKVPVTCLHCGQVTDKVTTARFCSLRCKNAFHYRKRTAK